METTTATRFKHINEFAGKIGLNRVNVYRALKKDDPETWTAYAEFIEEKVMSGTYKVAQAKQRIARASKLAETENIILHDEYLRETRPDMMGEYVNS